MNRILAALLTVLLLGTAAAQDLPPHVQDFLQPDSSFEAMDTSLLELQLEALLPASDSVFLSSSALTPLGRALLAVIAHDGPMKLYRYSLKVSLAQLPDAPAGGTTPALLVQVDAFNLGALQHADLVTHLGAEHVAPLEEFGAGPSRNWRLVLIPLMGQPAAILAAARSELTEEQAQGSICLGEPCLTVAPLIEPAAVWQYSNELDPSLVDTVLAPPHPVAMLDLVATQAGFDPYVSEVADQVLAEVLIETAFAQDTFIDVALRQGPLMDDSLLAVWQRAYAFPVGEDWNLHVTDAFECRRGDTGFAAPGEYCL